MDWPERYFKLEQQGSTVRIECLAGVTTFMTMSYILFVQPALLSEAGMDFNAVFVATALASALATLLMGLLANYPIALAPGMGHNLYFAMVVVVGLKVPWQTALGAIFISGTLFMLLACVGFREKIINAIPASLKSGIAVGIGLLITFFGLQWAGVVVANPVTLVGLGDLTQTPVGVALFGLLVTVVLMVMRVRGAILWGILTATVLGYWLGIVTYHGFYSKPPSLAPTLFKINPLETFRLGLFDVLFVFFFLDLFDTVGTLVGVGQQAGLMVEGRLPRARQALFADAAGTVCGALLGTSTVTSYVESAAGVAEGGRTGLSSVVTAGLMALALFFAPLVRMVGEGYPVSEGVILYPSIAPALIIIGSLMLQNIRHISWDDPTEYLPAFLTIVMMPFAFSITEGIACGFISYVLLKLATGRYREVHWVLYTFAGLFVVRYIWL